MVGDRERDIIKGLKSKRLSPIGVLYGFGTRKNWRKARGDVYC